MNYLITINILFLVLSLDCKASVNEEDTENVNLIYSKTYFLDHVMFMKIYDATNVKIKTDGNIVNSEGKNKFLVHVGMKISTKSERHSTLIYKILGISKENVIVEYIFRFDHRSFGNNSISIDRGRFEVPFFINR